MGARVSRPRCNAQAGRTRGQLIMRPAAVAEPATAEPLAESPGAQDAPGAAPTSAFDWFDHWWPIAYAKDIPAKEPYGFELLETPMWVCLPPLPANPAPTRRPQCYTATAAARALCP